MEDNQGLTLIRSLHTTIYLVMVAAIAVVWHAALTGRFGPALWTALALLAVESAVFLGNGRRCPLTALAVRYGAEKGYAFDTFLPERATRYTFRVFGTLMVLGLVLLALRAAHLFHL
jgi:hypothetical protein